MLKLSSSFVNVIIFNLIERQQNYRQLKHFDNLASIAHTNRAPQYTRRTVFGQLLLLHSPGLRSADTATVYLREAVHENQIGDLSLRRTCCMEQSSGTSSTVLLTLFIVFKRRVKTVLFSRT